MTSRLRDGHANPAQVTEIGQIIGGDDPARNAHERALKTGVSVGEGDCA